MSKDGKNAPGSDDEFERYRRRAHVAGVEFAFPSLDPNCPECARLNREERKLYGEGTTHICSGCGSKPIRSAFEQWVTAGRSCVLCGKNPAVSGEVLCRSCAAVVAARPKKPYEPSGCTYADLIEFVAVTQPLHKLDKWLDQHVELEFGEQRRALGSLVAKEVQSILWTASIEHLNEDFPPSDFYSRTEMAASFVAWYLLRNVVQDWGYKAKVEDRTTQALVDTEALSAWLDDQLITVMYESPAPTSRVGVALAEAPDLSSLKEYSFRPMSPEQWRRQMVAAFEAIVPSEDDSDRVQEWLTGFKEWSLSQKAMERMRGQPFCVSADELAQHLSEWQERPVMLLPEAARIYGEVRQLILERRQRLQYWMKVDRWLRGPFVNGVVIVGVIIVLLVVISRCSG